MALGRVEGRVKRRRGGGEKVEEVKLLPLRLRKASEGAHHFACPPNPGSGRLAATLGERRERSAEARLERRRQLTHQPACREEERRLPRDPALPPPGPRKRRRRRRKGGRRGGAEQVLALEVATQWLTHLNVLSQGPPPTWPGPPPQGIGPPACSPGAPASVKLPFCLRRWLILEGEEISLFPSRCLPHLCLQPRLFAEKG